MKQVKAIKKIEQGNVNDLLALFDVFQGKEVQITIESLDSDEEVFKKAGIENFLKDDDQADSIYDEKYRKLIA
jgi:hypothetical protein